MENLRRLAAPIEHRGANPYSEWGSTAPPPPSTVSGGAVGGLSVTVESATQVAAVYGCVGLLADSVMTLPLRVMDRPAWDPAAKQIETPEWLERPFEMMSYSDWIVCFVWSLALRGEFIGHIIERDRQGNPTQIAPVPPDMAKVDVKKTSDANGPAGSFEWKLANVVVPTEDIFHVKYQSMPGMIRGISPIQMMRYEFGLAHSTDVWAANFYQNSANPQGVIEVPGELNEAAAREMKSSWAAKFGGINQANTPAILSEGAKFAPINISPADQQLLESRKYSAEAISGLVFRVPPHMIGLNERSTSFGRGIEQQECGFVANTLSGYTVRGERALTECLPKGMFVNFDLKQRIRGSALELAQASSLLMLSGQTVADETRGKWFDLPPLPDGEGQKVFAPINTELLEKALEELKKLEAEPDVPPPPTIVAPPAAVAPAPGKPPTK